MSTYPQQPLPSPPSSARRRGFKQKAIAVGGGALALGVVIAWFLLTGEWGAKDFSGQDLRNMGDFFHASDMVKAKFVESNISGLDMVRINLHETDMRRVIAEGTDFYQGHLLRADLRDGNFRNANFREADLDYADLRGADLRGADLRGTNLHGVQLDGADLRDSLIGPSCDENRSYGTPDHCVVEGDEENPCCEVIWEGAHIDQVKVCRNPYQVVLRRGNEQGVGVVGVPIYFNNDTIEGGETLCIQQDVVDERFNNRGERDHY